MYIAVFPKQDERSKQQRNLVNEPPRHSPPHLSLYIPPPPSMRSRKTPHLARPAAQVMLDLSSATSHGTPSIIAHSARVKRSARLKPETCLILSSLWRAENISGGQKHQRKDLEAMSLMRAG